MDTNAPLLGEPLPVELMNTISADRDGVHDALRDADGTQAWLRAVASRIDLMTPADLDALTTSDLGELGARLIAVRDAARRLAAEATEDPRPPVGSDTRELHMVIAVLNQAAGDTPHWSALSWTPGREPVRLTRTAAGQTAAAVVSVIAEDTITLFSQDARHRLRACLAPGCVLYFLKNHSRREWCSAGCGNRARSARHYQRHRQSTA